MNRRELLGAGALLAASVGAARAAAAVGDDAIAHAGMPGRDYGPAVAAVRAYAERHRSDHSLPGLTIAMVDRDGFTAFVRTGYADLDRREPVRAEHLFQIGSITKQLAALCVMRLHAAGKLDPNVEVAGLLPGIGVPLGITLAHLIEHSSGLPDDAPLFPRPTGGVLWQGYAPRAHWSYSNTGYDLIGHAIERATGQSFETVVREQVFAPLGMSAAKGAIRGEDRAHYATGYRALVGDVGWGDGDPLGPAPWVDVTFAAGCVAATADDMARYLRWLIGASAGHGAPLLSDADARTFTTATIDAPDWPAPGARYGHGLATISVDGRPMLHHTGGMVAFSSSMHVDPAAGVACFASANIGGTGYRPRDVTAHACALLRVARDGGAAPVPKPTRMPFDAPENYAGRFVAADGRAIELVSAVAGLRIRYAGAEAGVDQIAPDQLSARMPALGRYLLKVERAGGKGAPKPDAARSETPDPAAPTGSIEGLWYGPDWFARPGGASRAAPAAALAALAGRYDNDDPWRGTLRVVARADGLWLDGTTKLTPLSDGSWRVGDEDWSPERVWFDAAVGGRAMRMSFSGTDYLRRADRPDPA